ncbi:ABC transporter ATP-binding protein [Actinomadura fibrosa]|uniref:ABC transporter ATP-binding protein n=1 Tax=Actinomadura fibrosa TaxID=111802 RepID=A0ABW2XWU8_9ACTN|nr:ABC transporter ATP-binding protein [Actinomadura fibrosa]
MSGRDGGPGRAADPEAPGSKAPDPEVPDLEAADPEVPDLEVAGLGVRFGGTAAVSGVSFALAPGERAGLIGESGCGKSVTALAVMGLLPSGARAEGRVRIAGRPVLNRPDREVARLRGTRAAMMFQEPRSALDPLKRAGRQVALAARVPRSEARARVRELLELVELDPDTARAYPHQLSGGQLQRVLLAVTLARDPRLLICDEPTTALDALVQRRVLDLIRRICAARGTTLLFISHDLAVVSDLCERVMVMDGGRIVEDGRTAEVFAAPAHDRTRALLAAGDLAAFGHRERVPVVPAAGAEE